MSVLWLNANGVSKSGMRKILRRNNDIKQAAKKPACCWSFHMSAYGMDKATTIENKFEKHCKLKTLSIKPEA